MPTYPIVICCAAETILTPGWDSHRSLGQFDQPAESNSISINSLSAPAEVTCWVLTVLLAFAIAESSREVFSTAIVIFVYFVHLRSSLFPRRRFLELVWGNGELPRSLSQDQILGSYSSSHDIPTDFVYFLRLSNFHSQPATPCPRQEKVSFKML